MKVNVNSRTNLYGLIGDPIQHSLSPIIHNTFFDNRDMDSIYISLLVAKDNLQTQLELLRSNFKGFNVTIPHKETIIPFLDKVDSLALEYGAVNTVKVINGKLIGYNTDGHGFLKSLHSINVSLKDKKVLLLGSGGGGRMAAFEIVKSAGNLTIAARNVNKAKELKEDILRSYNSVIDIMQIEEIHSSFDIIVNTTPLGMYPNTHECPIDEKVLKGTELVYDMIYNPYKTKLLYLGGKSGAKTINGLPMLVYQGLKSMEIWTGERSNLKEENYIFEEVKRQLQEGI